MACRAAPPLHGLPLLQVGARPVLRDAAACAGRAAQRNVEPVERRRPRRVVGSGGAARRPRPPAQKHCGNGEQPPAVFRLSPLLSRGALVVSERCYERDEAEYAGLVHFAELNDIAGAFERVAKPPRPAAAVDALAAAFRSRFAPRRLFERAGVYELMRQTAAEASAPAPAAPPYAGPGLVSAARRRPLRETARGARWARLHFTRSRASVGCSSAPPSAGSVRAAAS